MTGRINSFQSLGTVDGPGLRTVVFMQGCKLRCPYCHNPDTWNFDGGSEITANELAEKVLRYKGYFGENGGVTVSGGEPLWQADFLCELFEILHENGISTALDTSGTVMNGDVQKLLKLTDIVLLDIKYSNDEKYRRYIGVPLEKIIAFLSLCEHTGNRVIIRQVITQGINDNTDDIKSLRNITNSFTCIEKTELLPFRKLCIEKYKNTGLLFPFSEYDETSPETIEKLESILK